MNVKVHDVMTHSVITARRDSSVGEVRRLIDDHGVGAVPIVDPSGTPVGIVSSRDLLRDTESGLPVDAIMTEGVYTVPQYEDVSIAARVMRNHGIHRVVVTHEQRVVGVLTTFDLLKRFEAHRFVA